MNGAHTCKNKWAEKGKCWKKKKTPEAMLKVKSTAARSWWFTPLIPALRRQRKLGI